MSDASVKIDDRMLLDVCSQVSRLVSAKRPLAGELGSIADRSSGRYAAVLRQLDKQLSAGERLASALTSEETLQGRILAATIDAGEHSRRLDHALNAWIATRRGDLSSTKSLLVGMLYPALVVCILVISLACVFWYLVPEYRSMYAMFDRQLPAWLEVLAGLRQRMWVLVPVLSLVSVLPFVLVLWRHVRPSRDGLPSSRASRLRMQSLASLLAADLVDSGARMETLLPLASRVSGVSGEESQLATQQLSRMDPIGFMSAESSMILRGLDTGLLTPQQATEYLRSVAEQLNVAAEFQSLRQSRMLPVVVTALVGIVTVVVYVGLVYLPWILLLYRMHEPETISF